VATEAQWPPATEPGAEISVVKPDAAAASKRVSFERADTEFHSDGHVADAPSKAFAPPALTLALASALDNSSYEPPSAEEPSALDNSSDEPPSAEEPGKELINSLLQFLWWGPKFQSGAEDDSQQNRFEEAGQRLADNLHWIRRIREKYAPGYVPRPVPADVIFTAEEVRVMHNRYRDSLEWMPADVRDKYLGLQEEAEAAKQDKRKGKSKGAGKPGGQGKDSSGAGKPGEQEKTKATQARQSKKGTFNVCFFKAFGSKQLFWHLVKVGPETKDLNALLHTWVEIKSTERRYQTLQRLSYRKTEELAVLKSRYVLSKKEMLWNQWHHAPRDLCEASTQAYLAAKQQWTEQNRNTQQRGMHEFFDAEEY